MSREGHRKIMAKFACPERFTAIISQFHDGLTGRVQNDGEASGAFPAFWLRHSSASCFQPCSLMPSVSVRKEYSSDTEQMGSFQPVSSASSRHGERDNLQTNNGCRRLCPQRHHLGEDAREHRRAVWAM